MKTTTDTTLREVEQAGTNTASSLPGLVAEHPFLQGMTPEHLAILTECAMFAEFKKGEVIFHEGDPANRFYLVRGACGTGSGSPGTRSHAHPNHRAGRRAWL